jgi:pSer/pThr/pTyr-binding forkhead associated (FHA) protein
MRVTIQYQLSVEQGPRLGHVFLLENSIVIIGRDPLVDISLPDTEVSRQHARMARDENSDYKLQDLGSTNGTFVNGQRLGGEPYTLHAGQEIVLGSSVILRYEFVPQTDESEAASLAEDLLRETAVSAAPAPINDDSWIESGETDDNQEEYAPFPVPPSSFTADPEEPQAASLTTSQAPQTQSPPASPNRVPADPLVPAGPSEQNKKRRRTITWVVVTVALLMLCCCAFFLTAWYWWGDPLMEALGVY